MPRTDFQNPDDRVMAGFPEHGDPIPLSAGSDPDPAPAVDPAPAPEDPVARQLREMQAKIDRQEAELTNLKRVTPPPQPKAPAPANPDDDDPDWDQEFFTSPKKALAKFGEKLARQIGNDLTGQYQRDRSTQKFWEDFYASHPDLKQDHDLVDLTLKSNLNEMSSMPVNKAMDRLADLTRDRILRYAGGAGKPRTPKPKVEGASGASSAAPKSPAPAEEKILSISELIRARKDKRRAAAGA